MSEEKEITRAEKEAETQALLLNFLDLGCLKTFNKTYKELNSLSENAGKKLSNEEITSLIMVGAGLTRSVEKPPD